MGVGLRRVCIRSTTKWVTASSDNIIGNGRIYGKNAVVTETLSLAVLRMWDFRQRQCSISSQRYQSLCQCEYHVIFMCSFSWTGLLVPGRFMGVRLESNTPFSCAYADSLGFNLERRRILRVISTCSSQFLWGIHYPYIINLKWKWPLVVLMDLFVVLRWCMPVGSSCNWMLFYFSRFSKAEDDSLSSLR